MTIAIGLFAPATQRMSFRDLIPEPNARAVRWHLEQGGFGVCGARGSRRGRGAALGNRQWVPGSSPGTTAVFVSRMTGKAVGWEL